ncbi:MAG: hypothetical protein ACRD2P_12205 [Terriglobia bacterium]
MGAPNNLAKIMQADRLTFPGMLPREILIFKNWLAMHETEYDKFDYNVRIGAGVDPGAVWPDYVRQQAIANSQLRIDAIAWKAEQPTIIEVKDRAGASAIGQIVTYEAVWLKDNAGSPAPKLLLVTNRLQHNTLPVLLKAGISFEQVPTDFSSLARPAPPQGWQSRGRNG